ncbi:MAG: hypothetical protein SFY66_09760 [Oculatellaceae cyanobacterium bins.114]|nr:hypothetical protein [Oculatellaceae cyanobacterium bins.114]
MNKAISQIQPDHKMRYCICCSTLPLAVYREVSAHLRQVTGVDAGLLPQVSQQFDYEQSQIGGLWIEYNQAADVNSRHRVEQILNYYGDRYGQWLVKEQESKVDG